MDVSEINDDLHQFRPEYLEKLKKIDEGKFILRAELARKLKKLKAKNHTLFEAIFRKIDEILQNPSRFKL